jgi:hypothetical protein
MQSNIIEIRVQLDNTYEIFRTMLSFFRLSRVPDEKFFLTTLVINENDRLFTNEK